MSLVILAQGELLTKERERESEGDVPVNKGKKATLSVKHGIETRESVFLLTYVTPISIRPLWPLWDSLVPGWIFPLEQFLLDCISSIADFCLFFLHCWLVHRFSALPSEKNKQLKINTFSGIGLSGKLDSFTVNALLTPSTGLDPDLIISRVDRFTEINRLKLGMINLYLFNFSGPIFRTPSLHSVQGNATHYLAFFVSLLPPPSTAESNCFMSGSCLFFLFGCPDL